LIQYPFVSHHHTPSANIPQIQKLDPNSSPVLNPNPFYLDGLRTLRAFLTRTFFDTQAPVIESTERLNDNEDVPDAADETDEIDPQRRFSSRLL